MLNPSKICTAILILLPGFPCAAQDTLKISSQEFLAIVKKYHPLAHSYRLLNNIADAEILKARGNFDPVLGGKTGTKTIDDVNYYEQSTVGLEIPTWYGLQFNGNYNYIEGQKVNNSETQGGLFQFGVTIPLAKNLLYDTRRAVLDQARFARRMTLAEQTLLSNELLLEAENSYWEWVKNYEIFRLQTQAVDINRTRLSLIRKTYQFGESAAIDTTEALSQLQNFELQRQEAFLQFIKSTQQLQLFLWKENQEIYEINQLIVPTDTLSGSPAFTSYALLIGEMNQAQLSRHASLLYYFQKQNILESERRLKRQSFLPKLDLTYNFFNKENYKSEFYPLFRNNYQYELKLEIPVFLRQARADYRIVQTKILRNKLETDFKREEINTKLETYQNEVQNYREQLSLAERNIVNYRQLLQAEETRYLNGESGLFLINSRENKLIEARQKVIELRTKFVKSYNQLKWMNENLMED